MGGFTKPRLLIQSGTRSAQPSSSGALEATEGALYYVTDEDVVERYDGSAWAKYGASGYTLPDPLTVNTLSVTGTATITNEGLHLLDTNASHDLIIKPGTDLSADRILTLTTGDAARTITLSGSPTLSDWFNQTVKTTASPSFAGLAVDNADGYMSFVADGGSGRPNINFIRQTSGNLEIGFFDFYANNSSGTQTLFTRFKGEVLSQTSGAEVGYMGFLVKDTDQVFPINRMGVAGAGLLVAGTTGTLPSAPGTGKGGAVFYDIGTAFASMGTNSAAIYADDTAGTTEMWVIDEAGSKTQISPHNFTLFTPAPPDGKVVNDAPFSYASSNDYLGVEIGIDWPRLIAALEALTGQTFAHKRTFPPRSYQADARRNFEVDRARYEAWESLPPPNRAQTPEPPPPVIKRLPQWVQDRFDAGRKAAMDAELAVLDSELDAWEGAKPGRRAAVAARRGR